jgi:hypothetical protein
MRQVTIGKVSTRKGARYHLDTLGLAHCGAGTGRIMAATRWVADGTVQLTTVCRRCLKALRARLADAATTGDVYAADAAYTLTPADEAARRDASLLEDIRATLAARWAPPPPLTWEQQQRHRAALLAPA